MNMKKQIIKQLRSLSRVDNKEKTWISELSDDQLYNIYSKLRCGESLQAIAKHMKQVWKIKPSSSIHSLAQGIGKFQRRIFHLLMQSPNTSNDTNYSCFQNKLYNESTLMRMERIARDLEARINRMITEEKNTGVIYPHLNRDVQALANLRKSILKQKDWEMHNRDSIQEEQDKQMEELIKSRFDNMVNRLGDDGCERLAQMLHTFLERAEKLAIPMEYNDEGKLVPVIEKDDSH
jgi:hypothetical protein